MTQEPAKERKPGPGYRSEPLTYRDALERLAEDGYAEVDREGRTETLQAHLARLDGDLASEAGDLVRLEPVGEPIRPYRGRGPREEPEEAAPPDEVDLPPVVDLLRVRAEGEDEYLDEAPFARARRYARKTSHEEG